jgi:homoserine O-acetyltransferase
MNKQSIGLVEKKSFTLPGPVSLESGEHLAEVTLAYETYGELNPAKTNAILICHALSGDAHVAGFHLGADKEGWWEIMVGPGKAIDTDKYFVICSNILGSCMGSTGPSSLNPQTGKAYGLDFPVVTITDMVKAQKALIDHLGITKLLSVIGGSIGGMQTLEWSISFPLMVFSAIPLATTQRHSALAIAFNEVARQAIMADPHWQHGDYYGGRKPDLGLAVARMIGHITYLSDTAMRNKFGRRLQDKTDFSFNFDADFQVESYLRHQGRKFVERFDANSFLYITKAADYFDLTTKLTADGQAVFAKAEARYLVISFTSDWLYPTRKSKAMVKAMKKHNINVSFCEIEAEWGHDAFLLPNPRLADMLSGFLDRMTKEYRP